MDNKIDFVIPWVDSNDKEWQEEREKYTTDKSADGRDIRFRDFDNLQYWFRGVEKFAPWVNKIHFITFGHLPLWLNTDHPKLNIVKHEDYIPSEFLPTFSSHVIEINLHRIADLAEQFVYFNDDIFLTKKVRKTDFFKKGLPRDTAALNITLLGDNINSYAISNVVYIINKHFKKFDSMRKNFLKWYNPINGKYLIRTLLLSPWRDFPGFQGTHLTNAYLKSTYSEVWDLEENRLIDTCKNKFRDKSDLMQNLFKFWQLASGKFVPRTKIGRFYKLGINDEDAYKAIRSQRYKVVCLNDHEELADFEDVKSKITDSFETILQNKSSFEL